MTGNFDSLFERLLVALQNAERRHRTVRDSASDNSDWETLDKEVAIISEIIKWRRSLESLRTEVAASGTISDDDAVVRRITPPDSQFISNNVKNISTQFKFILLGKNYSANDWYEVLVKVCEIMILHRPYVMAAMDKDNEFNNEEQIMFSYRKSEITCGCKRLSNGLYLASAFNNQNIIKCCRRIVEKCGFSPDELQVETVEVMYEYDRKIR